MVVGPLTLYNSVLALTVILASGAALYLGLTVLVLVFQLGIITGLLWSTYNSNIVTLVAAKVDEAKELSTAK